MIFFRKNVIGYHPYDEDANRITILQYHYKVIVSVHKKKTFFLWLEVFELEKENLNSPVNKNKFPKWSSLPLTIFFISGPKNWKYFHLLVILIKSIVNFKPV